MTNKRRLLKLAFLPSAKLSFAKTGSHRGSAGLELNAPFHMEQQTWIKRNMWLHDTRWRCVSLITKLLTFTVNMEFVANLCTCSEAFKATPTSLKSTVAYFLRIHSKWSDDLKTLKTLTSLFSMSLFPKSHEWVFSETCVNKKNLILKISSNLKMIISWPTLNPAEEIEESVEELEKRIKMDFTFYKIACF
jgi:hypothetical protein